MFVSARGYLAGSAVHVERESASEDGGESRCHSVTAIEIPAIISENEFDIFLGEKENGL